MTPEQYLVSGDFGKAVEAFGAEEMQEPGVLVKRGQARWLQYLQEKKQSKAPLKKDDEAVTQAVKDLTEAKTAEGMIWPRFDRRIDCRSSRRSQGLPGCHWKIQTTGGATAVSVAL